MSNNEGYKTPDQSKLHFLTFTVVDWVDVFTRKRYRGILLYWIILGIAKKKKEWSFTVIM